MPLPPSLATCTRCGCTCNDIALQGDADRIVEAKNACQWGRDWFMQQQTGFGEVCQIDGETADIGQGVARAAEILKAARYPLIYGLQQGSTDDQRSAVALADRLGALIDTPASRLRGPSATTFRGVGEVSATLGEVRNRSDVVIFWGANPALSHPRHLELYSLLPKGEFLPNGRQDRTCIVIDQQPTATSQQADLFLQLRPGSDFEALWIMRAILANIKLDSDQVKQATGIALAAWQTLVARLKQAQYAAFFFDAKLTTGPTGFVQAEALQALVKDLNRYARTVCRSLGSPGNLAGAEQVLTWQTGYPMAVNLAKGFPRYSPGEYSADEVLSRGEVDAALILGSDSLDYLSPAAVDHLNTIPTITIDLLSNPAPFRPSSRGIEQARPPILQSATVAFRTSIPGIHTAGTTYRVDGVPLPLRAFLSSTFPSQSALLTQIQQTLQPV